MKEFVLTAVSNAYPTIYSDNSPSNFINPLPRPLKLVDEWFVALEMLAFDNNLSNLPKSVADSSNAHIILYEKPPSANTEPLLQLSFENNFYEGPKAIHTLLKKCIPQELTKYINSSLRNKKLAISVNGCSCYINETLCHWLKINVTQNSTVYLRGESYREFNCTKKSQLLLAEATTYGNVPSFIKVHLGEMRASLSGTGFHHELAIVPYQTPQGKYPRYFHEVNFKEFFKVDYSNSLEKVSIKLTDESGTELNLSSCGQSTFVKLKFKKMPSKSSFIVRLASDNSKEIFAENNASRFRIQLSQMLQLDGDNWEVALSSIHYSPNLSSKHYLKHSNFWIELIVEPENELTVGSNITLYFETDDISNAETLKNVLNERIERWCGPNIIQVESDGAGMLRFNIKQRMRLTMSPMFALVVGDLRPRAGQKNYVTTIYDYPSTLTFPSPVDTNRCLPHNIMLWCDFITPIIMGGGYFKILKLIPLEGITETSAITYKTYETRHLEYIDVDTDRLQVMEFELQDSNGIPLKFADENVITYITLMFNRKK
jgi:hypothetical protein